MEPIDKGKVIAEIKELYNDIDKCISELIVARGERDGNGISNAHWRMETLMVNTQQAICNVIDTFETKEVDLDESARHYLLHEHISPLNEVLHQADLKVEMQYHKDIENAYKAGLELGLNAKKGE